MSDQYSHLYSRGFVAPHIGPDHGRGMSVGLGNGLMLYAGDRPASDGGGVCITIFHEQGDGVNVATWVDRDDAYRLVQEVTFAINLAAATPLPPNVVPVPADLVKDVCDRALVHEQGTDSVSFAAIAAISRLRDHVAGEK